MPTDQQQHAWMAQWTKARVALRAQREADLRSLTAEQAVAAAEALLSIGAASPLPTGRWTTSGLVEQQSLFHRRVAT